MYYLCYVFMYYVMYLYLYILYQVFLYSLQTLNLNGNKPTVALLNGQTFKFQIE